MQIELSCGEGHTLHEARVMLHVYSFLYPVYSDGKYVAYATELGELEVLSVENGERLAELRIR